MTGKMSVNGSIIEFLCDTVADISIISKAQFERIRQSHQFVLKSKREIFAVNGKIKVCGVTNLKCTFSKEITLNVEFVVVESHKGLGCIIRQDVIDKTPIKSEYDAMKNKIENMTQEIERLNLSKRPIKQSQKQPCL